MVESISMQNNELLHF